jgi:hypothetical protein
MFDESYCVGLTLGAPEISIDGLNELAAVLALLGAHPGRGAEPRRVCRRLFRLSFTRLS